MDAEDLVRAQVQDHPTPPLSKRTGTGVRNQRYQLVSYSSEGVAGSADRIEITIHACPPDTRTLEENRSCVLFTFVRFGSWDSGFSRP